ncbi:hypothetical protein RRG08_027459 [Elysia crispata]|uniref:Uncharacterized protein n=1 Tax=Elysia crispata TaxID=231223 RepID=A0AAE0YRE6_9GAST|nr:hypothetical protein RRG08_027459 [Elysia crispata]
MSTVINNVTVRWAYYAVIDACTEPACGIFYPFLVTRSYSSSTCSLPNRQRPQLLRRHRSHGHSHSPGGARLTNHVTQRLASAQVIKRRSGGSVK